MPKQKKPEIIFAPGCFDDFEGTQEELDEFIAEVQKMFENPEEFLKNSREVSLDELDDETLEKIANRLGLHDDEDENNPGRMLH